MIVYQPKRTPIGIRNGIVGFQKAIRKTTIKIIACISINHKYFLRETTIFLLWETAKEESLEKKIRGFLSEQIKINDVSN